VFFEKVTIDCRFLWYWIGIGPERRQKFRLDFDIGELPVSIWMRGVSGAFSLGTSIRTSIQASIFAALCLW
jgi:hypothetical protein